METRIICISDIERNHRGSSLGEDLSVYHGTGRADVFGLKSGSAFYFRAFSYLLVLYGRARLTVDQRDYVLTPNTLISQSPLHMVQFREVTDDFEFKVMAVTLSMIDSLPLVNIRPRIAEGVRTHLRPVSILTPDESGIINHCFDDLAAQVERTGHRYRRELVENSICRFFLEYDNIFSSRADETADAQVVSQRQQAIADKFVQLVSDELLDHTDVGYYCQKMSITPQYLTRVMRRQTGMRPSDFIREMAYAEARNMLAGKGVTVQDVAYRLGFADQSSFGKFFKRCSGMSPGQFGRHGGDDEL